MRFAVSRFVIRISSFNLLPSLPCLPCSSFSSFCPSWSWSTKRAISSCAPVRVKAEEFGYGIPPRILGFVKVGKKWKKVDRKDRKEYGNTIWSLNWLPIGGFVRIKGEQGDGEFDADSFHVKPIWQRIVILAAGVGMNWILAAVRSRSVSQSAFLRW